MINANVIFKGIENSPASVVVTDADGNIVYINKTAIQTTGYSYSELMHGNPRILKSGHQSEDFYIDMWKCISAGKEWIGTFTNKKKNGDLYLEKASISPIYRENSTEIEYYIAIKEDITERKRIEDELRHSEERLREVLENTLNASYKRNLLTDNYDYLSNAIEKVCGYTPVEFSSLPIDGVIHIIHPDDISNVQKVISTSLQSHTTKSNRVEYRLKKKNGDYVWIQDQFTILRNENDIPISLIGSINDISDKKEAEELIKLNQEKLEETNNNKDKFFSIIAHDLRGPFQSLVGYINLIRNSMPQTHDTEIGDYLTKLYLNSRHVYDLLDNLLYWSRLQRDKIEYNPIPINIYEFVNDIIKTNDVSISYKHQELINDTDENVVLNIDENMFYSIIHNLLSNAIKFTQNGKKISIYSKILDNSQVEIGVLDEGIGLNMESIQKILSRHQSFTVIGTNKEAGSGIGLILVQEFLEFHNTYLEVESKIGVGSKFYFKLPILSC